MRFCSEVIIHILHDLRATGKTVVVVHHDLQTVSEYFDQVALLNVRLVASGLVAEVFNAATLRATYGGQIAFLEGRDPGRSSSEPRAGIAVS